MHIISRIIYRHSEYGKINQKGKRAIKNKKQYKMKAGKRKNEDINRWQKQGGNMI